MEDFGGGFETRVFFPPRKAIAEWQTKYNGKFPIKICRMK